MIVTTPQAVALLDAMKCLSFTRAADVPVLGLIENMSGYVCPCCGEISNVFSTGGGEEMAKREGLRFLGRLPVDTELVTLLDAAYAEKGAEGEVVVDQCLANGSGVPEFELWMRYEKTTSAILFKDIAEWVVQILSDAEGK